MMKMLALFGLMLTSVGLIGHAQNDVNGIIAFPESGSTHTVLRDGESYVEFDFAGWGPKWEWLGISGKVRTEGAKTLATCTTTVKATGAELSLDAGIFQSTSDTLTYDLELKTSKDTALTYFITGVNFNHKLFDEGEVLVTFADGSSTTVDMPLARKGLGDQVKQFVLVDHAGDKTTVTFNPPLDVSSDGQARIILAKELNAATPVRATMTVKLPGPVTYYAGSDDVPQDPGFDKWYTFKPSNDYAKPSETGMQDWMEKPAGKHGRILRKGGDLIYNGKPIKLWGLNNCYSTCAPEKEMADNRAAFYEKHGVNAVRLHKYADGSGWAGIQSEESFVAFEPEGLERMDYYVAQLKKHGIYTKLSSTFGVKLGPKEREVVPYMDEFGQLKGGKGRVSTGHGSVFLSRELQDLQIQQIVNILKHENPHTGLTYAEDPTIAVVELFNEDSALFFGTMGCLQKIPTLRKRASEQFFEWLKKRYGTKDALVEAWGESALKSFDYEKLTDESWEEGRIIPAGNPWYYDPDQLEGSQASRKRRLLDTMLFLYDIQNDFYARYVKAIHDAGYKGEILGSNWQAGRAFSHYYNLHSDYLVGLIDRHNYFGGGGGSKIDNATMLRVPGSGMLSAGMQQVTDRPFMLSEWIHVTPSEWGVEGPAIIGAYGMGLQGWDVSYMFQNRDQGGFSPKIGERWDVAAPQVMGVFPAVARQVLRGDVKEADVLAPRYVHMPSLDEGKLGFDDKVTQEHDVKTFDSVKVPALALAVARCVVDFTDSFCETPTFDLAEHVKDDVYASTTGQLRWKAGTSKLDGSFTMDTPATKAVVGFAEGQTCVLGNVTIKPQGRFGAVYVTAREPNKDIASSGNLLVVAVARARNTGMKVLQDSRILQRGDAPVVMEPVKAEITIRREGNPVVHVLDHDGCRTDKTLPVNNGTFTIDGARDQTPYYLVEY